MNPLHTRTDTLGKGAHVRVAREVVKPDVLRVTFDPHGFAGFFRNSGLHGDGKFVG